MISRTYIKKIFAGFASLFLFCIPVFAYAQVPQTGPPPSTSGIVYECNHSAPGDCTFDDVIAEIKVLVTFGRNIALGFSSIVLAYAGFLYMTSGDNAGKRKQANDMLYKVALGIVFIMAAWLIVNLITNALLANGVSSILQ